MHELVDGSTTQHRNYYFVWAIMDLEDAEQPQEGPVRSTCKKERRWAADSKPYLSRRSHLRYSISYTPQWTTKTVKCHNYTTIGIHSAFFSATMNAAL